MKSLMPLPIPRVYHVWPLLLAVSAVACCRGAELTKPVSVCDLLADPQKHRNKVVTVRGELIGTGERLWLRGERCPKPLITSGYEWPNPIGIWLTPPESKMGERPSYPAPPVSAAWKEAMPLLQKNVGLPDRRVWVTVTGNFETRQRFEMVPRGDGKVVPYGYGHLNGAPAQIVYYEFWDVEVKRNESVPEPEPQVTTR